MVTLVMLVAGIWGFYHFEQDLLSWQRVLGLIAVSGAALFVASLTAKGKGFLLFMGDARTEVRKVVWPTRTEAIQTTMIVLVVVILIGILLAITDMILGSIIEMLVKPGS